MTGASPEAPVLDIRDLTIRLRGRDGATLLQDVSLSVAAGETLCLVGESGSGKSLTSLATMGLLPEADLEIGGGSIRLCGEELRGASRKRLQALRTTRMSMIFQEPMTALNPVARIGDQIEEVLLIHTQLGTAERRARVLDILAKVNLPDPRAIMRAYPDQLSGGQRQRVMIAMALVLEPALLIADEPTTALDVTTQKQVLDLIRTLQKDRGTAILFITHDMGVVAEIADRVAVLNAGAMVETGSLQGVLSNPTRDYTRALLKAVPGLEPRPARPDTSAGFALELDGLDKTFGRRGIFGRGREVRALDDISLHLRPGRTLGIVGESGSGKSTLARCVMQLEAPDSGVIRVCGDHVDNLHGASLRNMRRRIQMVFQDPYRSLNPRVTVGETIAEAPINYGMPHAEALALARDLLVKVGLPRNAADRLPHQFSGGQRQRIAIARAIAVEPDVLVADEAVSALDVSVQAQVLDLFEQIQAEMGVAILFITHDLRVAARICDDIAVMRGGQLVEWGPAAAVLTASRQDYTRRLLAAAPGSHWDFARFRPFPVRAPDMTGIAAPGRPA
ncbi:dipeptide ABC transporter ATP-binding protein [Chachezhania sediminis]|uniref:dipeptide ABC transporter ATP-binding protein n=1 Tax=Chachezhania sediminis TaxID=2599291 RepID=UPI00131DA116|nr:ABC transporter ATP-binding protein [Chachezhania sediminis]